VDYNDYKVLNDYLSSGFEKAKFNPGEKHRIFKALENAKSKESPSEQLARMQALRLFCNQQGDIVALGALLKSTQKSWLEPFKINQAENNETLHKYLVETENDAYTKVVIPLWDNIMADKKGLIRKDLKSFYADIHVLQKATNQNQTVSNKVFIPLESGFSANLDTIFFQSGWGTLKPEEYNTLAALFKSIIGKALPLFDSVPYLKDAPFNLSNTTFDALTIEASKPLSLTDMAVIGKAAHLASLPLFERFVIEKEATTYILRSKHDTEEMVWCSQEDIILHDHLSRFHKTLVIAPPVPELKNLIVLKENELLDFLLDHLEPSNEAYTNAFTSVIVTKEDSFRKKFIDKLGTVVYNFEDNSGLTTLNNVVKVALSFSDISTCGDLLQTTFKFVVNAGLSFTLSDIISAGSDTIYFGDENQYQLKLSDIFTSDNVGYARYIEILIEKLTTGFSYDKAKLSQLLGLKTTEDKGGILARINKSIHYTGYPPNAAQLAFLLLYKKYSNKDFDLSGYSIKHRETARKLNGVFALSVHHFKLFDADAYLDERYDTLAGLLKLTDTTPSFKAGECSCYLHPVIENNVLLCPDLKESLQEEEQIQLLDFLIRYHKNSSPLIYRKTWSAMFGFRPELYNSSGKYMLKEVENFPEHIYTWSWKEADPVKKKHKASLLSALGFNQPWAPINTLREVLITPGTSKTFSLPELNDLPVELVVNTLVFLHQKLPGFKFNQQSSHYDLLKEMVKICIQHSQIKIPLPVSTGDKEEYHFVDPLVSTVYYYDVNKYYELDKLGLDVEELVRSTGCSIYNGSHWTESQELKKLLQEIEIDEIYDNDQVLQTREEWADKFYSEWKSNHPDISFYYYHSLPVRLQLQGTYIKTISEDKYYFNENAIHCPIKFSFSEIISTLKNTKWISLNALNDLESLFNMHQMKVAELLSNPIMDTELKKLVEDKRKELEQLAYRKELIESLSKSEYSLKWFMSFIELQINQDNESDHSIPEQELSFFHVEWDKDSRKLLNFKDPNRTVTPTIEYCTDFSATFIFNNSKPVELKIQDVSKKGQVLNVMPAKSELLQNINLNDIKRVDLRFSRSVDLLSRLLNAFKRLANEKSWQETYNLKDNLSPNIHFIFGPPGTGKTTTIAERITAIMNIDPAAKVLVLTPTNKAADVLTQRIMKCTGDDDYWLVRYGASFSNDIVERDLLQNKDSFIYEAYTRCVCITTIHRLPYEQAILKKEHNEDILSELGDMHWDYVIFDESSMIPLSYMMYAMYKCESRFENKATAFWVAGDPFQIPPVVEIDDEDLPVDFNKEANIYTMIGLNTFDETAQKTIPVYGENNKIENLTTQ